MQRKKTALRAHRQVSPPHNESGLIVTAKNARRSARTTRAVDNRSHRTPKLSCGRHPDMGTPPNGRDGERALIMMGYSTRRLQRHVRQHRHPNLRRRG